MSTHTVQAQMVLDYPSIKDSPEQWYNASIDQCSPIRKNAWQVGSTLKIDKTISRVGSKYHFWSHPMAYLFQLVIKQVKNLIEGSLPIAQNTDCSNYGEAIEPTSSQACQPISLSYLLQTW